MVAKGYAIQISDAVIADLERRLDNTRWPDELDNAGWEFGSNLAYMRSLVEYWRYEYSWRREEAALNELPQFRMALGGLQFHFVHVRGNGPVPLPLIIAHGWPGLQSVTPQILQVISVSIAWFPALGVTAFWLLGWKIGDQPRSLPFCS
jgi:hypothetical protein